MIHSVAVVVPILNEEEEVYDLLISLAKQTVKPTEVILVDNGSCDGTVNEINRFKAEWNSPFPLKILEEPRRGVAYARDTGWGKCMCEIMINTDADCRLPQSFIELILNTFRNTDSDVVTGPYIYSDVPIFWQGVLRVLGFVRKYLEPKVLGYRLCLGGNTAVKRGVLESIGGFSAYYSFKTTEDVHLSRKLRDSGYKVTFLPENAVIHSSRRLRELGNLGFLRAHVGAFWYRIYPARDGSHL